MRRLLTIGLLTGCIATAGHAADPWPDLTTTPPVDKRFTVTSHHEYRDNRYDPPAMVIPLTARPDGYNNPEEVLIGQISAMKALDYDWWLSTWDAESQDLIRAAEPNDAARAARIERWRAALVPARVELTHFIETARGVVIRFRLLPAPAGEDAEQARAFSLDGTGWHADLRRQDDPVTRYGGTGESRIETVVR